MVKCALAFAGADEDRTLSRLRGLRSDLIDPAIAAHHGRTVKRRERGHSSRHPRKTAPSPDNGTARSCDTPGPAARRRKVVGEKRCQGRHKGA